MRNLWRSAAAVALVSGTLAACASPHYPTSADETRGPPPLTMPKPQYSPDAAPAAKPPAPAEPADGAMSPASERLAATPVSTDPTPASTETAAPVSPVATAPLPAPAPTSAPPPAAAAPTAATPPAASPTAPSPPPAAAEEQGLTPQMVVHDQPPAAAPRTAASPPPRAPAYVPPPAETRPGTHLAIAGQVVSAEDQIFENYEVQKGDHIDALARAFSTTRKVLLDANEGLRAPYVLHPGQILKVPVAKAYVAESGDTLNGVARRFSVSVGELAEINHISERAMLRSGQRIGLPSSMRDRGPQRSAETAYAEAEPYRTPSYQPPPPSPAPGLTQVAPSGPTPTPERGAAGYQTPSPPAAPQATPLTDAQVAAAAHGRFMWPVRGDIVSHFGPQGVGRRNDGVDIKAAQGTVVKAAAPGEVVYAGDQVPGFGNLVLIKHADGWVTAYAHLDQVNVQMRQQVSQGDTLGSVGMTGGATEPELHFEVRFAPTPTEKARPVDPVLVLPAG